MTEEALTVEDVPTSIPAAPSRKRAPMSDEHKGKIRASNQATRERKKAEKPPEAPNVETGITAEDAAEMSREIKLRAAELRITEAAIAPDNRQMIHQEIRVDVFNLKRQYVELTPSMCRSRNCGFDAAREAGAAGWGDSPIEQPMGDGKTLGERLIALREYHEATAHTVQQLNDHIITADELAKRQWSVGQSIRNEVLMGAK